MAQDAESWLTRFASELGTAPPTEEELSTLLALAGIAAHASERTAAPISCWLAARAGIDPEDALDVGKRLAQELDAGAG